MFRQEKSTAELEKGVFLYLRIELSDKGLEGACFAVYQEVSFTWLR